MRELCAGLLLGALLASSLCADTHQVVQTTISGHKTIVSEYLRGMDRRVELVQDDEGRRSVMIENFERKVFYDLDPDSRQYAETVPQSPDWILSLSSWIYRRPRARESGKTVNVYYDIIDTGARKQVFGRTAKHLLLCERHVAEPGACEQTHQTEKDGWYIPSTETGKATGRVVLYAAYTLRSLCRDTIVRHGNPSPPGIAVLQTDGPITREVLELSNAALDPSLFEVPAGFKKVDSLRGEPALSWSARLQMEWGALERAFESWFE